METFKDYTNRTGSFTTLERYKVRKSLDELPDFKPYGFCILPDGSYVVVTASQTHAEAIASVYKGIGRYEELLCPGGIRMAKDRNAYYLEYVPTKVSRKALSTAKDICTWYNVEFEIERVEHDMCD